jgi:hypothetical protein
MLPVTRACATCRQPLPLREFDLGGGQLSTTCLGCAHERLRTEDHLARSQRNAQLAVLERRRCELIAALVKIDAAIADHRERPAPLRIVLEEGGDAAEASFDDDDFGGGADPGDRTRDEMS